MRILTYRRTRTTRCTAGHTAALQHQLIQSFLTLLDYGPDNAGTDAERLSSQHPGVTKQLVIQVTGTLLDACGQPDSQAATAITALVGPNGQPAAGLTAEQLTTVAILQGVTVKEAQGNDVTLWSIACNVAAAHQPRAA